MLTTLNLKPETLNKQPPSPTLTPLQKAAVLINALDMRSADVLLDQMPTEQADRVRAELVQLDEIPAAVQEQVIAEFLQSGGKLPPLSAPASDDVELELSDEAIPAAMAANDSPYIPQTPFAFLRDASAGLLAEFLRQEHPQTVAVILAHLDPDQAARVMERLPAELSTESLARMARLHQLSPEVLADLESEIRLQLLPQIEAERRPHGLAGASAVLSALNDPLRKRMLGQLAHRDQTLVRQLGYLEATTSRPNPVAATQAAKLTAASHVPTPPTKPARSALRFSQLTELSDAALKRIFAAADPQLLILALTGADECLVQRIVKQLPAADAAALRQRLNHPGPVRLRDIDAAQEQLAQLAADLHEMGVVQLPFRQIPQHLSLQS